MFNSLDDSEMETFLTSLNAPLRRMPQQERAELHLELRQHLDGLTAAYEELGLSREEALATALRSFGDPREIGRRMYSEWRRGQWRGLSDEMKSVLSMLGLYGASAAVLLTALAWSYTIPPLRGASPQATLLLTALFGVPVLAGGVLGRLFPKQAVSGAFYATIALSSLPLLTGLVSLAWIRDFSSFGNIALWAGCWLASGCAAAYVGSGCRQGRFRLSDLRLRRQHR